MHAINPRYKFSIVENRMSYGIKSEVLFMYRVNDGLTSTSQLSAHRFVKSFSRKGVCCAKISAESSV